MVIGSYWRTWSGCMKRPQLGTIGRTNYDHNGTELKASLHYPVDPRTYLTYRPHME